MHGYLSLCGPVMDWSHSINRREMLEKSWSYTMRKTARIKVYVKGGGFLLPFGSDCLNSFSHNIVWPVNMNNINSKSTIL